MGLEYNVWCMKRVCDLCFALAVISRSSGADTCMVNPAKVPRHTHIARPARQLWRGPNLEQGSSQPGKCWPDQTRS